MKLDPKYKPEKQASRDASRPVLTSCYLDAEAGVIVSTDSFALAVCPVEVEDGDVSGLIPAAALTAWRKASTRQVPAEISANGSVEVKGLDSSASFPRPEGQYPRWSELVKRPSDEAPEVQPIAEFGIDAKLLAQLAEAIGAQGKYGKGVGAHVRVKVYSPLKPIRVESPTGEAYGIVMPVRLPA